MKIKEKIVKLGLCSLFTLGLCGCKEKTSQKEDKVKSGQLQEVSNIACEDDDSYLYVNNPTFKIDYNSGKVFVFGYIKDGDDENRYIVYSLDFYRCSIEW